MGVITYLAKKIFWIGLIILLIIFIPGLPPKNLEFTPFSLKPPSTLEGKFALNSKLNNAERLFNDKLKGPECLAVYNGEIYSGIHGGHIVKIKEEDGQLIPVLKFGQACEGFHEEDICGRVLGLTFSKDGTLFVVDAYYGVFKVNLSTDVVETIAKKDEFIHGKPVKLPNAIDVSKDGNFIYWTISSTSHDLYNGVYTLFGDGNGRLMKTDLKKKTHEVLIDNLYFPNGVVLSKDDAFVLIAETGKARVLRYYLRGPNKGSSDVFIDGLPGLPDNLKRDGDDGFFIPLIKPIDKDNPFMPGIIAPYPSIRKFFARILALIELSIEFFNHLYPVKHFKLLLHFIGHFESLQFISGDRVTVVRTDLNGKVVETLHATDGKISDISDIEYVNGAYYLGSPFNPYLAKVVAPKPK